MARQFDIVENLNPTRRAQYPFLVVLQHDHVSALRSVIAAPLVDATPDLKASRLHPSIAIDEHQYVIIVEEMAAIPPNVLGRVVSSAEAQRYDIVAAIDLCFTGI